MVNVYFTCIILLIPFMGFHIWKLEFLSTKNALSQVWLKLSQKSQSMFIISLLTHIREILLNKQMKYVLQSDRKSETNFGSGVLKFNN